MSSSADPLKCSSPSPFAPPIQSDPPRRPRTWRSPARHRSHLPSPGADGPRFAGHRGQLRQKAGFPISLEQSSRPITLSSIWSDWSSLSWTACRSWAPRCLVAGSKESDETHDGWAQGYGFSLPHRYPGKSGRKIAQSDTAEIVESAGAPGRVRTSNPRFRRPILYPVELRAHKAFFEAGHKVGTTSITATIYHHVGKRQGKRGHSVAVMTP